MGAREDHHLWSNEDPIADGDPVCEIQHDTRIEHHIITDAQFLVEHRVLPGVRFGVAAGDARQAEDRGAFTERESGASQQLREVQRARAARCQTGAQLHHDQSRMYRRDFIAQNLAEFSRIHNGVP